MRSVTFGAPLWLAQAVSVGLWRPVLSFVVVMMLGTGLMAIVPTIAQSLASTATGLGSVAASTFRNAASVKGYGRTGIASGEVKILDAGKPSARSFVGPLIAYYRLTIPAMPPQFAVTVAAAALTLSVNGRLRPTSHLNEGTVMLMLAIAAPR